MTFEGTFFVFLWQELGQSDAKSQMAEEKEEEE